MAPTVQILIEADDAGAVGALDNINASAAKLTPTLQQVGVASTQSMGQLQSSVGESRIITDLLTGNISRAEQALVRLGARTQELAPLFALAFAPAAIFTFITLAEQTVNGITKAATATKAWYDAWADQQDRMNANLQTLGNNLENITDAQATKIRELTAAYNAAGLTGMAKQASDIKSATDAYVAAYDKMDQMQQKYDSLNVRAQQSVRTPATDQLFGADATRPTPDATQAAAKMTALNQPLKDQTALVTQLGIQLGITTKELQAMHDAENTDNLLAYNKQFEDLINRTQELAAAQKLIPNLMPWDTGIEGVQGYKAALEQAAGGLKTMHELDVELLADIEPLRKADADWTSQRSKAMQTLDMQMVNNMEADQKVAQNAQKQAEEYTKAWTRARDTMANQLDSFFNELTSGNIGQAFLKQFEKMVSQMVATWLMGIQGMQGAVTRSGGLFGSLGNFLGLGGSGSGGIFGGGASAAGGALSGSLGGGAFSFSPSAAGFTGPEADMLGLPLSSGMGGGSVLGGVLPAGAMATMGGAGVGGLGLGSLLKGLSSLIPMGALVGGTALLGKGGIAGLLGGGLTGFGAGSLAGSALSSLAAPLMESGIIGPGLATVFEGIAPFLGPIGAGIGLIGGLIGLFTGHGKLKIQQTQLLQQMQQQLTNLQNAFDVHQIDYNSAISQAEQIRQSYDQQQEALQQGGSAGRVDPWVNATEAHINQVEQQRQSVLTAAAGYGPAQFSAGGFVHPSMARMVPGFAPAMHFAMGGAVPAIVHAGEYVLNASAVNSIGRNNLDRWNSGGGGMQLHLNINAIDGKSVEELFKPGTEAWRGLQRNISRAINQGYL